ncbi:GlsB/YeaQ/YmgE family stress response membrane protein [Virgibacillus byunsanensis]|uniref:GlsB/YeaQ/YmgE family stress response membrane protein n=1 Tax=Virgibacillus byunsanensis TaxID=570945 RepID=A0ABW3LNQ2_9BACI
MSIITILLSVLIAMVIGTVADKLSPFDMPGSWAGAIIAGFIGDWIGTLLFGTWGPMLAGFSLVPALLGAIIVAIVAGSIVKLLKLPKVSRDKRKR